MLNLHLAIEEAGFGGSDPASVQRLRSPRD
jgi:hypothetical protein